VRSTQCCSLWKLHIASVGFIIAEFHAALFSQQTYLVKLSKTDPIIALVAEWVKDDNGRKYKYTFELYYICNFIVYFIANVKY